LASVPAITRGLVGACHPEPALAVTVVLTALAVSAGRGLAGSVAVCGAIGVGQLSIGWSNDYLDRERDRRSARLDKPVAAGAVPAATVAAAALLALGLTVPLSLASGLRATGVHLVAVAAGWLYNLRLKATLASVVPYLVAFGLYPAVVTLGLAHHPWPPWWVLAAGALLGAGAHFTNVLPDLDDDARTGVRGLPHRLGERVSRRWAAGLLVAATVTLGFGPSMGSPGRSSTLGFAAVAVAALAVGVGLLLGTRPHSRAAFRMTLLVAVLDVCLLIVRGAALR
jgi:4-hydroxybenzoate polyprenyltransferase